MGTWEREGGEATAIILSGLAPRREERQQQSLAMGTQPSEEVLDKGIGRILRGGFPSLLYSYSVIIIICVYPHQRNFCVPH